MSGEIEKPAKLKTELLAELQLMRPVDWEAYWKQVPWPKPNLIELAKIETSPLAAALNRLAPEILTEASEQLDPFGWLLKAVDVSAWSEYCRTRQLSWMTRIWHAGASQLRADVRLIHKGHGWAETFWKLRQNPANLRLADDYYIARLRHANDEQRAELLSMPSLADRLAKAREEKDDAFLRRFRRAKQRKGCRAGLVLAEKYVVQHWLTLSNEFPGLCFFSDPALDALLNNFGLSTGANWATKQLRTRLGLIQAGAKRHLIEDVIDSGNELRLTGSTVIKPWSIKGKIYWGKRKMWP